MALPDDVLTEIFSYLPTKSAGRLGSLSRSWRATLSSVHFVELHRRRVNRTGELKLFFADSREEEEESYFYGWQPGGAVKKLMPNNFDQLPTPMTRPLHGLVMVRCADAGYYVCNPSTGEVLALPDTKLPSKMIFRYLPEIPYYHFVAYGLGYCPVTHEYKVVRLFSKSTYEADDHEYSPVLCEVFVLDAPSYWRPTAQQPHACIVDEENPGVFLNGCLHFLCCDGGIIAFNVTTEIFDFDSVQPLPYLVDTPTKMMTELDGCLCVWYGDKDYADGMYHVWVLRNYEQQQWEQLCRIDPSQLNSCYIAPLGMYNGDNGQMKVMFGTGTGKVFSVDVPNSGAPEILFCPDEAIGCSFEDYNEPGLGLFEESLVRMGRTIEEMVSSSPITKAWFDVLKWMPTQSVAELRLVCREWCAMVEDDRFIRSHVVHANLNKSPHVMIITDYYYGQYIDLKDFTDRGLILVCVPDLVCSQPCRGLNVGSCHSRSFVCNPAMGYIERMEFENLKDDTFYAGRIGLGYDRENDEHVLVLMTYKEKNFVTREYQLECRLRYVSEQEWRSLDAPPRPVANIQPTYIDGKIFWMAEPNLGPISLHCEIIAFDVEKEEFEVLPGPPCGSHGNGHVSILELQGALCVACSDKTMNVISIWMMKEVGFWLKEYHIDLEEFSPEYSSEWTTPLAIDLKDGRILLNTGWSMGYYDPKTASMETIYRVGMPGDDFKFCPVVCHESLVSRFGSQPGYTVLN